MQISLDYKRSNCYYVCVVAKNMRYYSQPGLAAGGRGGATRARLELWQREGSRRKTKEAQGMKKWHVKLPEGKELWLESDTPHEDLEKMGYSAYALTDVRIIPERELPDEILWWQRR